MALTVKKITLWRREVAHQAGALAQVLEPLAQAGANLRVAMGYAIPGQGGRAAIEVYPVSGRKITKAASAAGIVASAIPCLLVEGDDRPGMCARMARGIADAGVNLSFAMAISQGRKFASVFGFHSDADAAVATKAIRAVGKAKKKSGAR